MIHGIVDDWALFGSTWCTLLAVAALLGLVGVPAVARDQVFAGVAVGQVAMLGIGLALLAGGSAWGSERLWLQAPLIPAVAGGVLAAAALLALDWRPDSRSTAEARTGWLYLAAASATLVLLCHSPVGLREVTDRLASSVIGASWLDAGLAGGFFLLLLGVSVCARDRLILWMVDAVMAEAVGLSVRRYRVVYALALGAALAVAIHAAGQLVAFGFLVLPALAAAGVSRETRRLVYLAPLVAAVAALGGIILSHTADLPTGPAAVLVAAVLVAILRGAARLRQGRT